MVFEGRTSGSVKIVLPRERDEHDPLTHRRVDDDVCRVARTSLTHP